MAHWLHSWRVAWTVCAGNDDDDDGGGGSGGGNDSGSNGSGSESSLAAQAQMWVMALCRWQAGRQVTGGRWQVAGIQREGASGRNLLKI